MYWAWGDEVKICNKCGLKLPLDSFSPQRKVCKECRKIEQRNIWKKRYNIIRVKIKPEVVTEMKESIFVTIIDDIDGYDKNRADLLFNDLLNRAKIRTCKNTLKNGVLDLK